MKKNSLAGFLLVFAISLAGAQAQTRQTKSPSPSPEVRPRLISPAPGVRSNPQSDPDSEDNDAGTSPSVVVGTKADNRQASRVLSPPQIQSRIAEAERLLKSRPLQTAKTSPPIDLVTLAALDRNTSRIHLVTIYKDVFLTKGSEITAPSSLDTTLNIRVLRANGVNTAVRSEERRVGKECRL